MKVRKHALLIIGANIALAACRLPASTGVERLEVNRNDIVRAVNKEICFDYFWNGGEYNFGSVTSLNLVWQSDHIDAWSDGLLRMRDRFVTHLIIKSNQGRIFVDSSESYNARYFPKMVAKLGTTDRIKLAIATNCEPTKAEDSAKTRLIEKIAANELKSYGAFAHRPSTKRIVIANVDDSYPRSFVYVPTTNELFTVAITPGTSYVYDADKPYLFGQIIDKGNVAAVRAKVIKYGITVTLELP